MVNPSTQSPFSVGGMVMNPDLFVGRQDAVNFIVRNMTKDQPVSLNIVGDRKSGKSSLLNYVLQTHEATLISDGKNPQKFAVIYLSAQDLTPKRRINFYQRIAEELSAKLWVANNPQLGQVLTPHNWDEDAFRALVRMFKKEGILPILLFDDIEELLEEHVEFPNEFFEYLRSLLNQKLLMMVLASRQRLSRYKRKYKKTSSFFNVVSVWPL